MKKIIFFSKNLKIGGMEKALLNLLNLLANKYEVTLVLEEKEGELLEFLNKEVNVQEYKLSSSKFVIWRKAKNFIKRFIWTIKNKNKYDFSCNYATYSLIGSYLALVSSKNNMLYVHSDYYNVFEQNKELIKDFFSKNRMSEFKTVAFVSKEAMNNMLKIYPQKKDNFIVINNLFDYQNLEKTNKIVKNRKKKFLFLGRLEEESKRLYRLFDALKICMQKGYDYELWIVGDGKDKKNYQNYIQKKRLDKNVFFYNNTVNISPYLQKCDILILSSEYEGFPIVYLEAIYFNKMILTTIKTCDDIIDISNYAMIVDKNSKSIANGMIKVVPTTKKYNFNFNNYNKEIIDKIEHLINRNEI